MRSALTSGHPTRARASLREPNETHPVRHARPADSGTGRLGADDLRGSGPRPTNAVADTYVPWRVAPAFDEGPRFAAYVAALDQEQTAAGIDAGSISELERRLWDSDPGRESEPRSQSG